LNANELAHVTGGGDVSDAFKELGQALENLFHTVFPPVGVSVHPGFDSPHVSER
jgi:hypothetical protein